MIRSQSARAASHNVQTVRFAPHHYPQCGVSHNQYSVYDPHRHYMWGAAPQQETLLEKVCAGAAFLLCIAVLMFMG